MYEVIFMRHELKNSFWNSLITTMREGNHYFYHGFHHGKRYFIQMIQNKNRVTMKLIKIGINKR